MKKSKLRLIFVLSATSISVALMGCGDLSDETVDEGLLILPTTESAQGLQPAQPSIGGQNGASRGLAAKAIALMGDGSASCSVHFDHPTAQPELLFSSSGDTQQPSQPEMIPELLEREGQQFLEKNFFNRRLTVATDEEWIAVAADHEEQIRVVTYGEGMVAQSIVDLPRQLENSYHQDCADIDTLSLVTTSDGLALVELQCGEETEVNVRFLSATGQSKGESIRFSIDSVERLSVDADYDRVVVFTATNNIVRWYEVTETGGVTRVMEQVLEPHDEAGRLIGITHNGTQALLQYSDGLVRRVAYAIRCGTTSEFTTQATPVTSGLSGPRVFMWDQVERRYWRYAGQQDGMDQVEWLPWNIGAPDSGMKTIGMPRRPATEDTFAVELVSTSEGVRLLYQGYGESSLVGDFHGEVRESNSGDRYGRLHQSWSGFQGGTSLITTQGRCKISLQLLEF